ncbi:MAG: YkgJ family cysteine cluster protein [bacterium]
MDRFADGRVASGSGRFDPDMLIDLEDTFVNGVYSSVDCATRLELKRLSSEEGVAPTCKAGCFNCCGQHILTNISEAQALSHYIKREFSVKQIEDLRIRTKHWHEWDDIRPGRYQRAAAGKQVPFSAHQYCPMLVDGKCSAYSMRPVICRTHFVSSAPPACRPYHDPESIQSDPVALKSVLTATYPYSIMIKDRIEQAGLNFCQSIMLLPHWLAIEMNWDFAVLA